MFSIGLAFGWYVDRRNLSKEAQKSTKKILLLVEQLNERDVAFAKYRMSKSRVANLRAALEKSNDDVPAYKVAQFRINAHEEILLSMETFLEAERSLMSSVGEDDRKERMRISIISSIANLRRLLDRLNSEAKTASPELVEFYESRVSEIRIALSNYEKQLAKYRE